MLRLKFLLPRIKGQRLPKLLSIACREGHSPLKDEEVRPKGRGRRGVRKCVMWKVLNNAITVSKHSHFSVPGGKKQRPRYEVKGEGGERRIEGREKKRRREPNVSSASTINYRTAEWISPRSTTHVQKRGAVDRGGGRGRIGKRKALVAAPPPKRTRPPLRGRRPRRGEEGNGNVEPKKKSDAWKLPAFHRSERPT